MNKVLEEMQAILDNDISDEELYHYGMPRRSGRYPWGSGENPYQRSMDFIGRVNNLKKSGWKETPENIKTEFGLTTKEYKIEKSLARYERRMVDVQKAESLKADGLGATEIGRKMGIAESTVRSLLNPQSKNSMKAIINTADILQKQIDSGKDMIDVGTGVERELNIPKDRLDAALYYLENVKGYPVYKGGVPQPTNAGQQTTQRVLCKPGTEHKEIYDYERVDTLNNYISRDGGNTLEPRFTYPKSMDSSRLQIRYAEDGGIEKDGLVELRRNVDDLSLGESRYSQVRIMVDDHHYIKGMAVYSDDMPPGVDVIFNTNKSKGTSMEKVLKPIKSDPDNPFGSAIKDANQGGQYYYTDKRGKKQLGLINKRADEGDWADWKDALPSQFLGKQNYNLANKQLKLARTEKATELEAIKQLELPVLKRHLLSKFADTCDSSAVNLQAAALPGQKYHVILPVNSLKTNEVYAPRYKDGTKLALVRYPHGGTFEIPILTVNNKNKESRKMMGTDAGDGIGINHEVAERLSGADFDGDTVMTIPTHDISGKVKISSRPPLKGLEGFDPKTAYPEEKGMRYMSKANTQKQMGVVSNLITDMTLQGANDRDMAKAVRHSMVVIDAEKHKLNYKQSEIDNDISSLKKKYQVSYREDGTVKYGGAATLLSRAKSEERVLKRQGAPKINMKGESWYDPNRPEGSLIYKTKSKKNSKGEVVDDLEYKKAKLTRGAKKELPSNTRTVVDNDTGKVSLIFTSPSGKKTTREAKKDEVIVTTHTRTDTSTRMGETDDARTLISSGKQVMETLYADHANALKALANDARKTMMEPHKRTYNVAAKKKYAKEVSSLNAKLNTALLNSTRERAALRAANAEINRKKQANPSMSKEDIKKTSQKALTKSRDNVGSVSRRDRNIDISDQEWKAIKAGAFSDNTLTKILNNTDIDRLRELATPRQAKEITPAKVARIKALQSSNYTIQEIAAKLGVSASTVSKYLKGA